MYPTYIIVIFSTTLSGTCSFVPQETWLAITQVEQEILGLAIECCSKASSSIDLAAPLYEMLQVYLKDAKDCVFYWPWALLRMAALHSGMADNVKTIVQSIIGEF